MTADPLLALVLLAVGLGAVYAVLLRGVRAGRGAVGIDDRSPVAADAFTGLTVALALQAVVGAAAGSGDGLASRDVVCGAACGVLYGVVVVMRRRAPAAGLPVRLVARAVEVAVGVLAAVPVTASFFAPGATCGADGGQPWWVDGVVLAAVVLALGAAVVLSVLRAATGAVRALIDLDVFLAYFGALELAAFFVGPFGLRLVDLPQGGWAVSLAGVTLVVAGCALRPRFVVAAAGAVLAAVTIAVDASVGEACATRSFGGVGVLASYTAALLLVRAVGGRGRGRG